MQKQRDQQESPQVFDKPFEGPLEQTFARRLPDLRSIVLECVVPCKFRSHILEQLDRGHQDAVLTLLPMMSPNLDTVDLSPPDDVYNSTLYRALFYAPYGCMCDPQFAHRVILKHKTRLQKLHSFTVRRRQDFVSRAYPARQLTSIKRIEVVNGDLTPVMGDGRACPPCDAVESLSLTNVKIDISVLNHMPRHSPELKSMFITLAPDNGALSRSTLGDAMRNSMSTLTSFGLDTRANDCHIQQATWEEGLYGELGSLREMTNLKRLSATPKLLLYPASVSVAGGCCSLQDVLPVNLRELTLLGSLEVTSVPVVDPHVLGQVKKLLSSCGEHLLECIRIQGFKKTTNKLFHPAWSRSEERCEKNRDRIYYTYRRRLAERS